MDILEIQVKRLAAEGKPFTKGGSREAGWDIYCIKDDSFNERYDVDKKINEYYYDLLPGQAKRFHTGIAAAIPDGWYAQVQDRSGMANKGIGYLGGVIDSTYRGEWIIILVNFSEYVREIKHGDRIAQFMLLPVPPAKVVEVDELSETYRGSCGFGGLTGQ